MTDHEQTLGKPGDQSGTTSGAGGAKDSSAPMEIDYDGFYRPAIEAGGFDNPNGERIRQELETSDEVTSELGEIGVTGGIINTVIKRWRLTHPSMKIDGRTTARFGIMREQSESEDGSRGPISTSLVVWMTEEYKGTPSRREREQIRFRSVEQLSEIGGLPHGLMPSQDPPETKAAQEKLRDLVARQPVLVHKASSTRAPRSPQR